MIVIIQKPKRIVTTGMSFFRMGNTSQNKWNNCVKTSHIGMHSNDNFVYATQYEKAFKVLYNSKEAIDTIALPLLYLLRHYIELSLKANIEYLSEFSGSKAKVKDTEHILQPLANAFREHWTIVVKKYSIKETESKDYFLVLYELVSILEEFDQSSMSFRYSHDTDTNKHFEWMTTIDISNIVKLYDKARILLNFSIDLFDDQAGIMYGISKEKVLEKSL